MSSKTNRSLSVLCAIPLLALILLLTHSWLNSVEHVSADHEEGNLPELDELKVAEKREEDPSGKPQVHRVSVTNQPSISASASEVYAQGRFQVETHLPEDSSTSVILNELLLRGGILISYDRSGEHEHLLTNGQRQSLNTSLQGSGMSYAVQRPRLLSSGILRHLDRRIVIQADERILLLMPEEFELHLLTEMERILDLPLDQYRRARLDLNLSRGGHLRFTLQSIEHNDGQIKAINRTVRHF